MLHWWTCRDNSAELEAENAEKRKENADLVVDVDHLRGLVSELSGETQHSFVIHASVNASLRTCGPRTHHSGSVWIAGHSV